MKILVTGNAGFIGFHISKKLLESSFEVLGIDNLNEYYSVDLKLCRLQELSKFPKFKFIESDISNIETIMSLSKVDMVIHLAAQAGVRYSLENPNAYIESNIVGFHKVLEACRKYPVKHLIFASSSSVYGSNTKVPFEETDSVDHPVSLYAATKKSNELLAYTYSHLYKIPITGLRFFTVYGPYGRPDMAYYNFVDRYFKGEPIHIYNNGDFDNDLYRDFTYIDDVVDAIIKLMTLPPKHIDPYEIFNIGNNQPERLMTFITTLEQCLSNSLNKRVVFKKNYEPMKQGDVKATFASVEKIRNKVNFNPKTNISHGLQRFTDWYVDFYKKK